MRAEASHIVWHIKTKYWFSSFNHHFVELLLACTPKRGDDKFPWKSWFFFVSLSARKGKRKRQKSYSCTFAFSAVNRFSLNDFLPINKLNELFLAFLIRSRLFPVFVPRLNWKLIEFDFEYCTDPLTICPLAMLKACIDRAFAISATNCLAFSAETANTLRA